MMRWLVIAACLLVALGGYLSYSRYHRAADARLQAFADAITSKDRKRIADTLQGLLAENARVHLEVSLFYVVGHENQPPMVQDFDKAGFIAFLDNIIYPLQDYDYTATLEQAGHGKENVPLSFTSKQWADGVAYYGGTGVNMRYSSDAACEATASFESGWFSARLAQLGSVSCQMQLRVVPKPGEAQKIQRNSETMRELLR